MASRKQREMVAPPARPGDGSWGLQQQRYDAVVDLAVVGCEFPEMKICAKADGNYVGLRVKLRLASLTSPGAVDMARNLEETNMSVKVLIPTPLRVHAQGKSAAEFRAQTVSEALSRLTTEFAELKRHLFTEEGKLRSFVNVCLNGEDIRYLAQEKTPAKEGTRSILFRRLPEGRLR
ncbi:MAG: hypothetical protein WBL50_00555 [Candidatus Acidiferrum sp.]